MSFFKRRTGSLSGGLNTPSFDPFNRYSNSGNGAFGFRKDKHVIIPGVTTYEENRLRKIKNYVERETGQHCDLPQELINDVYSMYVNEDVKRRPKDNSNSVRHQVLDKVYNSLTKVVTKDSPLYTQILTRELALALHRIHEDIKDKQEQQFKSPTGLGDPQDGDGQGQSQDGGDDRDGQSQINGDQNNNSAGKGDGGSTRPSYDKDVQDALDKAESNIQKAMDNADDKIKEMEDQLGKEAMKDLSESEPEFLEKIDKLKYALKNVSINKESIGKVLEKVLNESQNYFSTKFKRVEESLFDCEECEDLFGLEFLHPVFKNANLMDIGNETRIYKGKIDLFLDCSGSMSCSENFEGTKIRMSDLVKGIAMVLFRMGMIENLYFFDNNLYKIDNINEFSILSFSRSGGTNFEKVIEKIKQNGNNSVIITDGEDSCATYDKRAFWVGVGGTKFKSYYGNSDEDKFPVYRGNRQCVTYNSATSNFDYCTEKSKQKY